MSSSDFLRWKEDDDFASRSRILMNAMKDVWHSDQSSLRSAGISCMHVQLCPTLCNLL